MATFEPVTLFPYESVLSKDTKQGFTLTDISYLQGDLPDSSGPSGPSSDGGFENTTCIVGMGECFLRTLWLLSCDIMDP